MAAVIGGVLVLGGVFGLQQAGLLKFAPEPDQRLTLDLSAAERKIAELERELGDLGSRVGRSDVNRAVSALETKVSGFERKLEEAVSEAPADVSPAIDALKSDVASLQDTLSKASANGGSAVSADLKPIETRLAKLEEAATVQAGADLKPLSDRLAKLEQTATTSSSNAEDLSGSVADLESQIAGLKTGFSELGTKLDNIDATAKAAQTAVSTSDVSLKTLADSQARASETLSGLSTDIQSVGAANDAAIKSLQTDLTALSSRLAKVEATMGDATAREVAARALSVSALKSAVDSGRPYATELAAVKAGLPSDVNLEALEANAQDGVQPTPVLIAKFPAVARKIYQTFSEPDREGDVLDSLLASARSLVAVRGPGAVDGTGPEAALRRMENAVSDGDLKAAIAAYQDLPEPAKAAGADWIASAKARVEVDALTDQASQEVLNALAAKDS